MGELLRLDKVLGNLGYGTRKEVKKLVKEGLVEVDGVTADDPGLHVDPEKQEIDVSGKRINYKKYIYIMMNKPDGVISATDDLRDTTVIDILPDELAVFNISPVGRLDKDTVGLLLLTNDGQLTHKLLSPKKHVPKVYYAKVQGIVTEKDGREFVKGVTLDDGYKTLPAELEIIKSDDISEIKLKIFEGKYHQVKRMFEAVGKKVIYLRRLSMGTLVLDETLAEGDVRELTEEEVNGLFEYIN